MDFVSLILVLILYYLRPQEWSGVLSTLRPIQIVSLLILISLFRRKRGLKLRDFFQTPHDWIMFTYFGWTIFSSPTPYEVLKNIQGTILYYIIGVQALTTIPRLRKFLTWWAGLIMGIVVLALLSQHGFDPLGSADLTEGVMKGRLALNLSIFNNANSLAHAIIPVFPMLYFLLFWKRIVMKATLAIMILPFWCLYLTESKGAFICCFITIATVLTFGRPLLVQALIIVGIAAVGTTVMLALPRMSELQNTKNNPAIQGRIAAATFGMKCMEESWTGVGMGNFVGEFLRRGPLRVDNPVPKEKIYPGPAVNGKPGPLIRKYVYEQPHHYYKAPHGTYNQNGAELGYPGLFLFVGVLYCCLRTLFTAKTRNDEEERIRRILFSIVISYAVSCWMVDFFYRVTFILFVAATGAFHRHLAGLIRAEEEPEEQPVPFSWRKQLQPLVRRVLPSALPQPAAPAPISMTLEPARSVAVPILDGTTSEGGEAVAGPSGTIGWRRIGIVDLIIIWILTWAVIQYWGYIIRSY